MIYFNEKKVEIWEYMLILNWYLIRWSCPWSLFFIDEFWCLTENQKWSSRNLSWNNFRVSKYWMTARVCSKQVSSNLRKIWNFLLMNIQDSNNRFYYEYGKLKKWKKSNHHMAHTVIEHEKCAKYLQLVGLQLFLKFERPHCKCDIMERMF